MTFRPIRSDPQISRLLWSIRAALSKANRHAVIELEPKWKSYVTLAVTVATLLAVVAYAFFTIGLWSEAHRQTRLTRKANRAYIYLRPQGKDLQSDIVPLGWPFSLEVVNLGSQPAYSVRVSWQFDADSSLFLPLTGLKEFGVVFPGQPVMAFGFLPIDSVRSHENNGLGSFLHAGVRYRDIEGIRHYYIGLFLTEFTLFSEPPNFVPILADADTT